MDEKIIYFVDENNSQAKLYKGRIARILPNEGIRVDLIYPPYRSKEEYLPLLEDTRTACFILDQKLKDTGIATYTGIELAKYLRSVDTKVPIYILTNVTGDSEYSGNEWSVEDIIPKDLLTDQARAAEVETLRARMLRRINIYSDILGEREQRFRILLQNSLVNDISDAEIEELNQLQLSRTAVVVAREQQQLHEMEEMVRKHKEVLEKLLNMKDEI